MSKKIIFRPHRLRADAAYCYRCRT